MRNEILDYIEDFEKWAVIRKDKKLKEIIDAFNSYLETAKDNIRDMLPF